MLEMRGNGGSPGEVNPHVSNHRFAGRNVVRVCGQSLIGA